MVPKEFDLEGKVAIVTGSARGIGKAISLVLAECGIDIVVTDRLGKEMEKTAEEVRRLGRRALTVRSDVTKAD